MTRNELERYLGRCVTITLLDNTVIEGTLHKTGEKAFENDIIRCYLRLLRKLR